MVTTLMAAFMLFTELSDVFILELHCQSDFNTSLGRDLESMEFG